MTRGTLFLVVGPSGAGKDTLLAGARAVLEGDGRFLFARRWITRPADAGGEDHIAVTEAEFTRLSAAGAMMLEWRAHGLRYGIPAAADDALAKGVNVIANVSRGVIREATKRFAPVCTLSITVPPEMLRSRLEARGRESAADIAGRLERASAFAASHPEAVEIVNDSTVEDGVRKFIAALQANAR